jgi:hypothetical protein
MPRKGLLSELQFLMTRSNFANFFVSDCRRTTILPTAANAFPVT